MIAVGNQPTAGMARLFPALGGYAHATTCELIAGTCIRIEPRLTQQLRQLRDISSYTESHLATDNELVRNILLALLSSLAKVEAQKISERTRAGVSRARAKGIKIHMHPLSASLICRAGEHVNA